MTTVATIDEATIRALEPGLLMYARRRVGDDLAHDLVQDTWLSAMNALTQFEGRSSLRTWLLSILRRKIIDVHRRARPVVTFEEHHTPPLTAERVVPERMDHRAGVEVVEQGLSELPRREREAVLLVDVEGLDRDEASTRMGINRGALRVLLHRGRQRLKRQLEASDLGLD